MGRTAPPAGASVCINPITFSPVHGTVLAPIYRTERCLLRSTSRANALTIQNVPTSVQELSSELTVLTFKLSNQITLQQPVDTTAISRTDRGEEKKEGESEAGRRKLGRKGRRTRDRADEWRREGERTRGRAEQREGRPLERS